MRRRHFLGALAGAAAAACVAPVATKTGPTPIPSSLLALPSMGLWPARYQQAPHAVRDAYAFAIDHRAELRYIPCFCGCGQTAGHRNNWDCFVKEQTGPGAFILDPHGLACGTCVGVALDVKAMLATGMRVSAIRAAIDEKWAATGPATRTPYPDD
ncbi:MAG TPA: PCYCGC motif-containing (lipo)protein [Candidatus Limnocylindria bacterium]|nr:PCYCGC motif-containing (lipo)protein [Candidatus Limnocylindria bacterium]